MHTFRWLKLGLLVFTASVEAHADPCPCCSEEHAAFDGLYRKK